LVASANQLHDSRNGEAIERRELASKNGITIISSTGLVVKAGDICVDTPSGRITSVDSTIAVVVAVGGIECNVVASSGDVA